MSHPSLKKRMKSCPMEDMALSLCRISVIREVKPGVVMFFTSIPGCARRAMEAGAMATPMPVPAHVRLVRASSLMHR